MANFSYVQEASNQADPASATFPSPLTQGNLLVALAMERAGQSDPAANYTITGSDWTQRFAFAVLPSDTTYRSTLVCWTKVAGASEPQNVQVDDGTANAKALLLVEYAADTAGDWVFQASATNDSNTSSPTSLSTGTTGSVAAGDLLLIGLVGIKESAGGLYSGSTWTASAMTDDAYFNGGSYGRSLGMAHAKETSAGTKTSTASWGFNPTTALTGILVFSFGTPEPTYAPPPPRQRRFPLTRFFNF